ncbi:MAG: hypothetical protein GXP25_02630 [Planctomycetes bacterium]|nr:hypothetical protein [Planctomycetota bacterium]
MQKRSFGNAPLLRCSHRARVHPRGPATLALLCLAASVLGCASVKLEIYRKPSHDFHSYERIAVVPIAAPGKETEDKEHAQVVTALLGARLMKEHYDIIDGDTASAQLLKAGLHVDGKSDPSLLKQAAERLGVRAILTGNLDFYGPYDYRVPPSPVPYEYYDWYGYRRTGYYYEPGYTDTGSRAAMTIKLFDADLGTFVWWAKGDRSGSERIAQRYANEIIKKAVEKLHAKPKKKDKKKD